MSMPSPRRVSRRSFLKGTAILGGAALLGLPPWLGGCASTGPPTALPAGIAIPISPFDLDRESASVPVPHAPVDALFPTYFLGGFECSTHHRKSTGQRLDMIAATGHDRFAQRDYARLGHIGASACRDGTRWHLIESVAGRYDFSSLLPMVRAAQQAGIRVIWDLLHYGWPDNIDIFSPRFVTRFARYARAVATLLDAETSGPVIVCPVNEISFFAWAGGDYGFIDPFAHGRGLELKVQLVRAAIEAMHVMRDACRRIRFLHCDPLINVLAHPDRPEQRQAAESYNLAQYQAWDMIRGDVWPQLGGSRDLLDIVGANFYYNNQTFYGGRFIGGREVYYKPFSEMLLETWRRYRRPMLIAETGIENDDRAAWLRYVASEAGRAMQAGCELHGLTWYPILNHPGWENDRHCLNGLWDYADSAGNREIFAPLAKQIVAVMPPLAAMRARALPPAPMPAPDQPQSAPAEAKSPSAQLQRTQKPQEDSARLQPAGVGY